MKILMAADVSPLQEGSGAERVLREQAKELARRGHEVHIFFRSGCDAPGGPTTWQGCRLHPYTVDRQAALPFFLSTIWNGGRSLRNLLKDWRPDIVNLHQPFTGLPLLLSWPGQRPAIVYTFLSPASAEYLRQPAVQDRLSRGLLARCWHESVKSRLMRWVEGAVLRRARGIIVLSDFSKQQLRSFHPHSSGISIRRIPGGVDTQRFSPAADRSRLAKQLGLPEGKKILLTVRNLEPRCGVENLLNAVAELVKRRRDFLLLVAGQGPLFERLQATVESMNLSAVVQLLGFVPEQRLVDLYRVAELYVQPDTELQGFGLTIVEALACGTPVLATPVGGALETLASLSAESLFSNSEPQRMARELDHLLDDTELLGCRSELRRFAESRFSWRSTVEQVERCFLEVIGQRQPGR
ncbi:MAG: glycosyltransferase family 4 protein [Acidobacteriota bacterium]